MYSITFLASTDIIKHYGSNCVSPSVHIWAASPGDFRRMKWNKKWQLVTGRGLDSGVTCCSITSLPYLTVVMKWAEWTLALSHCHTHSQSRTHFFHVAFKHSLTFPYENVMKTLTCGCKLRGNVLSVPSVRNSPAWIQFNRGLLICFERKNIQHLFIVCGYLKHWIA